MLNLYGDYIGIIGIMEKKMETTLVYNSASQNQKDTCKAGLRFFQLLMCFRFFGILGSFRCTQGVCAEQAGTCWLQILQSY